ncbi:putative 1,4-beta-D-glucan cellobiohydrolase [Thermoanaerobacterium thermosaccharolyticum]|uniref:beta-fructofuranosidase n=1 Tax=Thermoanaerobacterium thermosaccharolyticum TaxID=1517 RepID=A0A223I0N9_THETR|nr:glycoside hydrolase family 32 protein [Thermoanaerobacterium thermosaccharolyticum]AST58292.1 putative 1,4-beta-D-glucan cellobiohydrolase [Thermoanaerobacterium thermosaccharolyticum]
MKVISIIMVVICVIFFAGCGEKEDALQLKNDKNKKENVELSNQVIRRLFPRLESAWVGDVMPLVDGKEIYINYLYETDYNGVAYHPIYQFTTTDFCEYRNRGEVIPFGRKLDSPDLAIGTGSFIRDKEGIYHCFYTGHNDKAPILGIDKECIMHAVSKDNLNWEKIPEDTFYAPEGFSTDDFRDPFVMWNEEEKCYWMILGAKENGKEGSCIVKYTSDNLKNWTFQGIFYEEKDLYFMECPNLLRINEWYYLIFSWNNVTYYRMSRDINGPWIQPENDTFDGKAFYAAKAIKYNGNYYLLGFIARKKCNEDELDYSWAGNLCVYELVQKNDGTLGVKVPREYENKYFTKIMDWNVKEKMGGVFTNNTDLVEIYSKDEKFNYASLGILPKSMLLSCKISFDESSNDVKAGFIFGIDKKGGGYPIVFNISGKMICYDGYQLGGLYETDIRNMQKFVFKAGETYNVKVVVEDEIITVYVDDMKVLSNRIYNAINNKWGFFVSKGKVVFSDITIKIPEQGQER